MPTSLRAGRSEWNGEERYLASDGLANIVSFMINLVDNRIAMMGKLYTFPTVLAMVV